VRVCVCCGVLLCSSSVHVTFSVREFKQVEQNCFKALECFFDQLTSYLCFKEELNIYMDLHGVTQ